MTPKLQLRTRCAITVVSVLLLATPVAYAEEYDSPDSAPTVRPSATHSFAGRPAGEGRPRPGRTPQKHTPYANDDSERQDPDGREREEPRRTPSGTRSDEPSASVSPSRTPSATPSRTRPSVQQTLPEEDEAPETDEQQEALVPPTPTPSGSEPAAARQQAPQAVPQPVAQQISPLSLGIGMALMGLGIGFLGVRLRRR